MLSIPFFLTMIIFGYSAAFIIGYVYYYQKKYGQKQHSRRVTIKELLENVSDDKKSQFIEKQQKTMALITETKKKISEQAPAAIPEAVAKKFLDMGKTQEMELIKEGAKLLKQYGSAEPVSEAQRKSDMEELLKAATKLEELEKETPIEDVDERFSNVGYGLWMDTITQGIRKITSDTNIRKYGLLQIEKLMSFLPRAFDPKDIRNALQLMKKSKEVIDLFELNPKTIAVAFTAECRELKIAEKVLLAAIASEDEMTRQKAKMLFGWEDDFLNEIIGHLQALNILQIKGDKLVAEGLITAKDRENIKQKQEARKAAAAAAQQPTNLVEPKASMPVAKPTGQVKGAPPVPAIPAAKTPTVPPMPGVPKVPPVPGLPSKPPAATAPKVPATPSTPSIPKTPAVPPTQEKRVSPPIPAVPAVPKVAPLPPKPKEAPAAETPAKPLPSLKPLPVKGLPAVKEIPKTAPSKPSAPAPSVPATPVAPQVPKLPAVSTLPPVAKPVIPVAKPVALTKPTPIAKPKLPISPPVEKGEGAEVEDQASEKYVQIGNVTPINETQRQLDIDDLMGAVAELEKQSSFSSGKEKSNMRIFDKEGKPVDQMELLATETVGKAGAPATSNDVEMLAEKILSVYEKQEIVNGGVMQLKKLKLLLDQEVGSPVNDAKFASTLEVVKSMGMISNIIDMAGDDKLVLFKDIQLAPDELGIIQLALGTPLKEFTKDNIVSLLNAQEEMVLAALKKLQDKGILRFSGKTILIPGIIQE
nr:hypothetical protein [Candidatus Sigynarchaeota archaeon]